MEYMIISSLCILFHLKIKYTLHPIFLNNNDKRFNRLAFGFTYELYLNTTYREKAILLYFHSY